MINRKSLGTFASIALLVIWGLMKIPTYHAFTEGDFELGPNEFNYLEVESESASPIRIELTGSAEVKYDAYLLDEKEMGKRSDR